jgi:hypothetical protein
MVSGSLIRACALSRVYAMLPQTPPALPDLKRILSGRAAIGHEFSAIETACALDWPFEGQR